MQWYTHDNYNSFERLSYELLKYFKNRYFSGLMISSSKKKKMQRSKCERYPANIYLFKVNNKNIRTTSLTSFLCFNYLIAHISHLFLLFLLSTLNKLVSAGELHEKMSYRWKRSIYAKVTLSGRWRVSFR